MKRTALLILAAGGSRRFGKPKQLLDFRGTTLLRFGVNQTMDLPDTKVFLVLGAYSEIIVKKFPDVEIILNNNWESGMGSSISKGMKVTEEADHFDRVLITLGDLPLLESGHYLMLLNTHHEKGGIVAASYDSGITGVPAVFGREYYQRLQELDGDHGAKLLLKEYIDKVTLAKLEIPYNDIDTPEDYEQLVRE